MLATTKWFPVGSKNSLRISSLLLPVLLLMPPPPRLPRSPPAFRGVVVAVAPAEGRTGMAVCRYGCAWMDCTFCRSIDSRIEIHLGGALDNQ